MRAMLCEAPDPRVPVRAEVTVFPLEGAGEALEKLRAGDLSGAAVLVIGWVSGGPGARACAAGLRPRPVCAIRPPLPRSGNATGAA